MKAKFREHNAQNPQNERSAVALAGRRFRPGELYALKAHRALYGGD